MARLAAVIDANILFRRYLRDTLLHAADAELFRPLWTDLILDEACRHLVGKHHMTQAQVDELKAFLLKYFEGAWVDVSAASLAVAVTKDPGDQHVLAAAIEEEATIIVTENVSDFPPALLKPHGVTAMTADQFLLMLYGQDPTGLVGAIRLQHANYKKNPKPISELMDKLAKVVPQTVAKVRKDLGV